jgi:hypothetical protein
MDSFVLQDWTTVVLGSGQTATQPASDWLDLAPYQDAIIWVEISQFQSGNALTLSVQTAPARDSLLFSAMTTAALSLGLQMSPVQVGDSPAVPLARWVRWNLTTNSGGQMTFRITVMANQQGG